MRKAIYSSGGTQQEVEIIRQCRLNTRIAFSDGRSEVVPNSALSEIPEESNDRHSDRIIPETPLSSLYREMRSFKGSCREKFGLIRNRLGGHHGAKDVDFITELFDRSISATMHYKNEGENFYLNRKPKINAKFTFASSLVSRIASEKGCVLESRNYCYVDFEIFPLRTTKSCRENGMAATHGNAGGIDVLLAANDENRTIPTIVEIKAQTESVGPTFAFIQALMYSSQLLTPPQFSRLKKHYQEEFAKLDVIAPAVEILILMEQSDKTLLSEDLVFAKALAQGIQSNCSKFVRRVGFLQVANLENGCFEAKLL